MIARVGGLPCRVTDFSAIKPGNRDGGFVDRLLERTDFTDAAAFPSGRAALVAALRDAGVSNDDEVLIPGYTCHSVDVAVQSVASPVYVDVTPDLCIDAEAAANKVNEDTAAIVPVHTFGQLADIDGVRKIAERHDLTIIEDAAHALGTTHTSDKVGQLGEYCFFSFRFSKEVTRMNGGILIAESELSIGDTTDPSATWPLELAGILLGEHARGHLPGRVFQPVQERILRPFFTSSSGALGGTEPTEFSEGARTFLAKQDERLSGQVNVRRRNATMYDELLPDVDRPERHRDHSYYRYSIFVDGARDEFAAALQRAGVGCSRMYTYVISPSGVCPTAETVSKRIVNLPVHAGVGETEIRKISEVVATTLQRF